MLVVARRKPARKPAKSSVRGADGWNFDVLVAVNQRALEAWAHGMKICGDEWGRFLQGRFQEDLASWRELSACSDLAQAFAWQRQYAQKATTDYVDEATKLSRLAMAAAREDWRIFDTGTSPAALQEPRAE